MSIAFKLISSFMISCALMSCNGTPDAVNITGVGGSSASTTVQIVSGNQQTGLSGSLLPSPIVFRVLDPTGLPVANSHLLIKVASGAGSVSTTTPVTDVNGLTSIGWTLGTTPGYDLLTVNQFSDIWSSTPDLTLTAFRSVGAASIATSTIAATSPVVADGIAISNVTITLLDARSQPIVATTPTFTVSGGGTGACQPTNLSGVARCTLTSTVAGSKTISLTSPVSMPGGSVIFQAGPAKVVTVQDSTSLGLFSAFVTDAHANPIAGQTIDWSVTAGGGSLGSATSITDSTGIAVNTLTTNASGIQKVTASAHGVSGASIATFIWDLGIWTFNPTNATAYTFGTTIDFTSTNIGELKSTNPPANSAASLSAGAESGMTYGTLADGTTTGFKLGSDGTCDGTTDSCASRKAVDFYELNAAWTPQWANVVGYWKFSETAFGTAAGGADFVDSSPLGLNPGTKQNGITLGAAAKMGTGITMNGSNSEIKVPNTPGLAAAGRNYSIFTWVKPSDVSNWHGLISKNNQIIFSITNGQLVFVNTGVWCYGCVGNYGTVVANQWQHIGVVQNAAGFTFYINGRVVGTYANTGQSIAYQSDQPMSIGFDQTSGGRFAGVMDEMAVWNSALSYNDVQTLYERQSPAHSGVFTSPIIDRGSGAPWTALSWLPTLPYMKNLLGGGANESQTAYSGLANNNLMSGIVGLWHLDDASTSTTVLDSSGNGYDGTLTGTASLGGTGKLNTSLTVDGSTGYALGNIDGSKLAGDYTISGWTNEKSQSGWGAIFSNNVNVSGAPILTVIDNTTSIGTNAAGISAQAISVDLGSDHFNKWIFVSLRKSGSTLYVDAWKDGTQLSASGPIYWTPTTSNQFFIGRHYSGATQIFNGRIDEVAVWSRSLTNTELKQVYQRGASRAKFQVRSCTVADCSDQVWQGPDGTAGTYYSELNNTTGYDKVAKVSTGPSNAGAPVFNFANYLSSGANRYFQYRTILESDATQTSLMPELKSISVSPNHYDTSSPTLIANSGVTATYLTSFVQTLGPGGCNSANYNLGIGTSASTAIWYYFDIGHNVWSVANGTVADSSSAANINGSLSSFPASGSNQVFVKTFLGSNGTTPCELLELQLTGHD